MTQDLIDTTAPSDTPEMDQFIARLANPHVVQSYQVGMDLGKPGEPDRSVVMVMSDQSRITMHAGMLHAHALAKVQEGNLLLGELKRAGELILIPNPENCDDIHLVKARDLKDLGPEGLTPELEAELLKHHSLMLSRAMETSRVPEISTPAQRSIPKTSTTMYKPRSMGKTTNFPFAGLALAALSPTFGGPASAMLHSPLLAPPRPMRPRPDPFSAEELAKDKARSDAAEERRRIKAEKRALQAQRTADGKERARLRTLALAAQRLAASKVTTASETTSELDACKP